MTPDSERRSIRLVVNGRPIEATVEPRRLLADFLRRDVGLTGTHLGCEHGICGACTILLDGAAVRSCLLFAVQVHGREVATVEGLAADGPLHPIQEAFQEEHALQCGFCTPGFLTTLAAYLEELDATDDPSDEEIREAISGNICRCTGYVNIVRAVRRAIALRRGAGDVQAGGDPQFGRASGGGRA
ncbi:MAG TPA: (2Fe-2S)-binding protein [Dehalococcoidia bacterium]|nr:(2Fe-2S)-binding protein [Dehalococcoidia bacterium]